SICKFSVTFSDFFYVFFFQAEDGIRDFHVTGVQTCALPIYSIIWSARVMPEIPRDNPRQSRKKDPVRSPSRYQIRSPTLYPPPRSEERRVGKEIRRRVRLHRYKKKAKNEEHNARNGSKDEWQ